MLVKQLRNNYQNNNCIQNVSHDISKFLFLCQGHSHRGIIMN